MTLRDEKSKNKETSEKVTVLKRPISHRWEDGEITKLACNLRVGLERYPNHPRFVVIRGEYDLKRVQKALGKSDFHHQIITVSESKVFTTGLLSFLYSNFIPK